MCPEISPQFLPLDRVSKPLTLYNAPSSITSLSSLAQQGNGGTSKQLLTMRDQAMAPDCCGRKQHHRGGAQMPTAQVSDKATSQHPSQDRLLSQELLRATCALNPESHSTVALHPARAHGGRGAGAPQTYCNLASFLGQVTFDVSQGS